MDDLIPLPPTFNSSDFEVSEDEAPTVKKRKTGHRIATAILRNQAEDRVESKKALRTLKFAHGAPRTRADHDAVETSWDAYCQSIGLSVDECPKGDQIFQFIDTVIRNSKSSIAGKHAISLRIVESLLGRLVKLLTFRHEDFLKSYTRHHVQKIEVHLQQLVTKGRLIKGTWFKKQWISFATLLKMAGIWFQVSLNQGTNSWDKALSKITSVVVTSALSARSGDVTRSKLYEGLECLCWKDVILKLNKDFDRSLKPAVGNLRGSFLLRFTKYSKQTRNKDLLIYCDPLTNTSQSPACAVKLILINALRHGYVEGSTLDEVLSRAAQRVDRTIQWTKPDAPVFSQFHPHAASLILEKPAGQEQVRLALREIAYRTGMLEERIDTISLRRGALRDQSYLPESIPGVANRSVAMIAGHRNMAYNVGTTREYVGPLEISPFNLRAVHSRIDKMAPKFAEEAPSKHRRVKASEMDEYMRAHNMNLNNKNERKKASNLMKKARESEWREEAKTKPLQQRTISEANVKQSTAAQSFAPAAAPSSKDEVDGVGQKYLSAPPPSASVTSSSMDDFEDDLPDPDLRAHDEALRKAMEDFTATIFSGGADSIGGANDEESNDAQINPPDDVDLAMQDASVSENTTAAIPTATVLTTSQDVQLSDLESMSGDDFVRFFSRINIYQTQKRVDRGDPEGVKKLFPCGNSRDDPTLWQYYCKEGCGFSFHLEHVVKDHQVNCNGQSREQSTIPCPRTGCGKSFKNEKSMKAHVASIHDWTPKPCGSCPPEPVVLFQTSREFKLHRNKVHGDPMEEQDCPKVEICKSEVKFTSRKLLKSHLKRIHQSTTKEIGKVFRDFGLDNKPKVGKKKKPLEQIVDEQDDEEEGEDGT